MIAGSRPHTPSPRDALRLAEIERLARSQGVAGLIDMLDDPSWAVRRTVVAALAAGGSEAVHSLCAALRDRRDNETRIAATVDALSAVAGDADTSLTALIADSSSAVLADVAQILGRRRAMGALPAVVALSRHTDDNVAVAAIEALGRLGGRAAVDSLVDAVQSGNFFRVFPAIEVLGRSGDPRAVGPLATLLDRSPYTAEAARALGRTGDLSAVPPLMQLIARSPGATVRLCATALRDLYVRHRERFSAPDLVDAAMVDAAKGPGVARHLLRALSEGDPPEQAAICFLLGVLSEASAAPLLTALLDATPAVAEAAAAALRALGPQVEMHILEGLRTGDSPRRRVLLPFVAGGTGTDDVVACLRDDEADVRILACDALARVGAVAAVATLFPLLADPDGRVAYAAVAAIQSLGSRETNRLAVGAARSPDVRVRRAALRILAYFGSSDALPVFLEALEDPDDRVRESAVSGLPFMDDPRAFDALLGVARNGPPRTRAAAMRGLGQCVGEMRASAQLLRGLGDADAWVRYYACQALGHLAIEPAAEALVKMLADSAGQVRVAAVEALSCLRGPIATEALAKAFTDADPDIQRAALVGLGVSKRDDALPLILDAARSSDEATRLVAVSALAGFRSPEVLDAFRVAAGDDAESVRTAAIGFLSAMPGTAATDVLIGLHSSANSGEQITAALALPVPGRMAGLEAALATADDETAPVLTSALARMRRPDATAALLRIMTSPNVAARKAAASTLAVLGTKEALTVLQEAAHSDPEPEVRQICSLLLAR